MVIDMILANLARFVAIFFGVIIGFNVWAVVIGLLEEFFEEEITAEFWKNIVSLTFFYFGLRLVVNGL